MVTNRASLFSSPTPTLFLPKPRPSCLLINNIPLTTKKVSAIINLPSSVIICSGSGGAVLTIFGVEGEKGAVVQWDEESEELIVDELNGNRDHRGFCKDCMIGAEGGAVDFRAIDASNGVDVAMRTLCPPDYFDLEPGSYRLGCVESKDYTDEELRAEEEIMGGGEVRRDTNIAPADPNRYFDFKVPSWPLLVANKEGEKPDVSLKEFLKHFEAPVRSEIMMAGGLSTYCFAHLSRTAEKAAGDFGWFYSQATARSDYYYLKCLSTSIRVLAAAFTSNVDEDVIVLGISGREVLNFVKELKGRIRGAFEKFVNEIDDELMGLLGGPEGHVGKVARSMGIPCGEVEIVMDVDPPETRPNDKGDDEVIETLEALGFHRLAQIKKPNEDIIMLAARVIDDVELDYCREEAESLLLQVEG